MRWSEEESYRRFRSSVRSNEEPSRLQRTSGSEVASQQFSSPAAAFGCGCNRSLQFPSSNHRAEDVVTDSVGTTPTGAAVSHEERPRRSRVRRNFIAYFSFWKVSARGFMLCLGVGRIAPSVPKKIPGVPKSSMLSPRMSLSAWFSGSIDGPSGRS